MAAHKPLRDVVDVQMDGGPGQVRIRVANQNGRSPVIHQILGVAQCYRIRVLLSYRMMVNHHYSRMQVDL